MSSPESRAADPFAPNELIIPTSEIPTQLKFPVVMTSRDVANGESVLKSAQRLHTDVYLDKGYIEQSDINDDGLFVDEYADRSVYLFAEDSKRDSACRYIEATKKGGIMSLPTAKYFELDPEIVRQAAGGARLSNVKSSEVVEVSGLASVQHDGGELRRSDELDATRLMYARILRDSLDKGHKLWLLNTHEGLVRYLEVILGKDQVHRLGDTMEYMGSPTVPVAINPQEVVRTSLADDSEVGMMKRRHLVETLRGVSDRHLSKELIDELEKNDIEYDKSSRFARLLRNKKALGYAAIAGYTIARAVPVANVEGFEGNPWIFFGIDFATSFPYAWGLVETVTGKTPLRRVVGGTVAAGSFAAPYVYFWAEGEDYPMWVNGAVAGIIALAGTAAVLKIRKDNRLATQLSERQHPAGYEAVQ